MARGSIRKDVAGDGTVSWRVRVDVTDAQGKRHRPQRTYPSKGEAERGLREWLSGIEALMSDEAADEPEPLHAWLVERIAEAWADAGPTGTVVITARCVQCGCTAEFSARGVPACRVHRR